MDDEPQDEPSHAPPHEPPAEPRPEPKPIVIRAPEPSPVKPKAEKRLKRSETQATDPAAPGAPSGRAPREPGDTTRLTLGLGVTILGAVLADLTPFFPWWRIPSTTSMSVLAEFFPSFPGRSSWQGLFCLLGGVALLSLAALWNSGKVPPSQLRYVTVAIMATGGVVILAGLLGVFLPPASGELPLTATIWLWLGVLSGVIASTGGALLQQESDRPAARFAARQAAQGSTEGTSGAFLINSMDDPPQPPAD